MYNVWFCDCIKAINALQEKFPNLTTFSKIEGNVYGDFIIRTDAETFCVKHSDFSIWKIVGDDWRERHWEQM